MRGQLREAEERNRRLHAELKEIGELARAYQDAGLYDLQETSPGRWELVDDGPPPAERISLKPEIPTTPNPSWPAIESARQRSKSAARRSPSS